MTLWRLQQQVLLKSSKFILFEKNISPVEIMTVKTMKESVVKYMSGQEKMNESF